jgi:hypothetical protein
MEKWFFDYIENPQKKEIVENIKVVPLYKLQPRGLPIRINFPKELNYTIKNLPFIEFPRFYSLIISWVVWQKEGNWEKLILEVSLDNPDFIVYGYEDLKISYFSIWNTYIEALQKFAEKFNIEFNIKEIQIKKKYLLNLNVKKKEN